MPDRGPVEPPARGAVRAGLGGRRDEGSSAHGFTLLAVIGRCRRSPGRIRSDRLARSAYALQPTARSPAVARLCAMHRPEMTSGERPVPRGVTSRWATIRQPVLDITGAALLWTAIAVDLATRPLEAGQSATTPIAYLLAGAVAAPFAIHRRFPVLAMAVSSL